MFYTYLNNGAFMNISVDSCGIQCPYFGHAKNKVGMFYCRKAENMLRLPADTDFPEKCPLKKSVENTTSPTDAAVALWRRLNNVAIVKRTLKAILANTLAESFEASGITLSQTDAEVVKHRILKDVFVWYTKLNYGASLNDGSKNDN